MRNAFGLGEATRPLDHFPLESPWASPNHLLPVEIPNAPAQVTRRYAMSIPAVKRARGLIATSLARLPLIAYRDTAELADQPRFLTRTDGPISPFHRTLWTVDDLFFHGWSAWAVERAADNSVIAADRIPFEKWTVVGDKVLMDGKPVDDGTVILFPSLDEGLLVDSRDVLIHAHQLNSGAAKAASNPAHQILLKQIDGPPMPKPEVEEMIAGYLAARRSPDGGVAYANRNIDVIESGKSDPALLIAGRNTAAIEVARATGVPASLLDASLENGSMTYANVQDLNRHLIDYALAPFMAAIAARLGMDDVVPRGTRVEFDTSTLVDVVNSFSVPDDNFTEPEGPTNG